MLIDTEVLSNIIMQAVRKGTVEAYKDMGLTDETETTPEETDADPENMNKIVKGDEMPDDDQATLDNPPQAKAPAEETVKEKKARLARERRARTREEKQKHLDAEAAKTPAEDDELGEELGEDTPPEKEEPYMDYEEFLTKVKTTFVGRFPLAKALLKDEFGCEMFKEVPEDRRAEFLYAGQVAK